MARRKKSVSFQEDQPSKRWDPVMKLRQDQFAWHNDFTDDHQPQPEHQKQPRWTQPGDSQLGSMSPWNLRDTLLSLGLDPELSQTHVSPPASIPSKISLSLYLTAC